MFPVFLFVLIPFEFFKSEKNKESIAAFFSMIFYCFYGLTWSLWSSLGISQALFHTFLIWMLVNLKRKNFFVAKVKKSIMKMDLFTGKLRDQGSKFSHETRKARLLATLLQ